jgi:hypothetical protein
LLEARCRTPQEIALASLLAEFVERAPDATAIE